MRIALEPTEPDEKGLDESIERARGGALIALDEGPPRMHVWGPLPEVVEMLDKLAAELRAKAVAEISRRVFQAEVARMKDEMQTQAIRQHLANGKGIARP